MSAVVVFTGPTITAEDARGILDATYLPPAAAGDLYVQARERPLAIALIDGLFGTVASVFHKEILWAMHEGVHVFGASSMGALRAAELDQFGMVGVGAVYEAYRSESLVDDDEVTVAHYGDELGYRAVSDAMVNIRATLDAASAASVLARTTRDELERLAKAAHYPERSMREAIAAGRRAGLPADELDELDGWLAAGDFVDLKRADAIELLLVLRDFVASNPEPKQVSYPFAATAFWDSLRIEADRDALANERGAVTPEQDHDVLVELRLDPAFTAIHGAALSEVLARREADRDGYALDADSVRQMADDLWHELGLDNDEDVTGWVAQRDLDAAGLRVLLLGEARRRWAEAMFQWELRPAVLAQLRLSPHYPRLRERAEAKRRHLAARGLDGVHHVVDLEDAELWAWWFSRQGHGWPPNLLAHTRARGFADESALRQAVIDEYHFVSTSGLADDEIVAVAAKVDADPGPQPETASVTVSPAALRALLRRVRVGRELEDEDIVGRPSVADV